MRRKEICCIRDGASSTSLLDERLRQQGSRQLALDQGERCAQGAIVLEYRQLGHIETVPLLRVLAVAHGIRTHVGRRDHRRLQVLDNHAARPTRLADEVPGADHRYCHGVGSPLAVRCSRRLYRRNSRPANRRAVNNVDAARLTYIWVGGHSAVNTSGGSRYHLRVDVAGQRSIVGCHL